MCGRFTLDSTQKILQQQFHLTRIPELKARYNIAPTQQIVGIKEGPRELTNFHWGLIPSWAKEKSIGNRMINARSETLTEKPAFRSLIKKKRCLVLSDGFYEWKKIGDKKQPFHFRRKDRKPFAIGALWDVWTSAEGEVIESCTLITTAANKLMADYHERMPLIIEETDYDTWLNCKEPAEKSLALLRPASDLGWEAVAVSTYVNKPTNDDVKCLEPVA